MEGGTNLECLRNNIFILVQMYTISIISIIFSSIYIFRNFRKEVMFLNSGTSTSIKAAFILNLVFSFIFFNLENEFCND